MKDSKLGTKRTCQECGVKFYDLNHDPIGCPKCDAVYDLAAERKSRLSRKHLFPAAELDHGDGHLDDASPFKGSMFDADQTLEIDDDGTSLEGINLEIEKEETI